MFSADIYPLILLRQSEIQVGMAVFSSVESSFSHAVVGGLLSPHFFPEIMFLLAGPSSPPPSPGSVSVRVQRSGLLHKHVAGSIHAALPSPAKLNDKDLTSVDLLQHPRAVPFCPFPSAAQLGRAHMSSGRGRNINNGLSGCKAGTNPRGLTKGTMPYNAQSQVGLFVCCTAVLLLLTTLGQ